MALCRHLCLSGSSRRSGEDHEEWQELLSLCKELSADCLCRLFISCCSHSPEHILWKQCRCSAAAFKLSLKACRNIPPTHTSPHPPAPGCTQLGDKRGPSRQQTGLRTVMMKQDGIKMSSITLIDM